MSSPACIAAPAVERIGTDPEAPRGVADAFAPACTPGPRRQAESDGQRSSSARSKAASGSAAAGGADQPSGIKTAGQSPGAFTSDQFEMAQAGGRCPRARRHRAFRRRPLLLIKAADVLEASPSIAARHRTSARGWPHLAARRRAADTATRASLPRSRLASAAAGESAAGRPCCRHYLKRSPARYRRPAPTGSAGRR